MNYNSKDNAIPRPSEEIPTMNNIFIDNIQVNNIDYLFNIYGSAQMPITNVHLSNIHAKNITKNIVEHCFNVGGACDNSTVEPGCPKCMISMPKVVACNSGVKSDGVKENIWRMVIGILLATLFVR